MFVLVPKEPSGSSPDRNNMCDQSLSPLFALPAELRNTIWSYLLVHPCASTREEVEAIKNPFELLPTQRFCANILQTCQQAHAEGSPILYGENVFRAHPTLLAALPAFLLATLPTYLTLPPVTHVRPARWIRKFYIHVRLDTDPRFSAVQAVAAFSGVDDLDVDVYQSMYASCDFEVLKVFEGVRGVGKAVVRGSVGDGNYARWLGQCMQLPIGVQAGTFDEAFAGGRQAWDAWTNGNR